MVVSAREEKREKNNPKVFQQKKTAPLNTLSAEIPFLIPLIRPTLSLSPNPLNLSPYHSLIQAFRLIETLL